MNKTFFISPTEYDKNKFASVLSSVCEFKEESAQVKPFTIYDSFDWRLYKNAMALYQDGHELILRQLTEDRLLCSQKSYQAPVFIKDMTPGSMRDILAPVLEMRALIPVAGGEKISFYFRVLNSEYKTVAWIVFEELRGAQEGDSSPFLTYMRMEPVRGYSSMFSRLETFFIGSAFQRAVFVDLYTQTLVRSGVTPGDYSSKVNIELEPDAPSGTAVKRILLFLFEVMQANEPGIKGDIDSEFTHDFRVAVRRTRSAFTQLKGVYPAEKVDRFKADFADLGRLTNPLRDLDVFLLKEDIYQDMLPDSLKEGILQIFDFLKQGRSTELEKVRLALESPPYNEFKRDYLEFLQERAPASPGAPNSRLPVIDLAKGRIYKRYRRILREGRQARTLADEQDLHRLRIECKKLRYLIEFFSSLFPDDKIAELLKQLRKLQDNLGDFNDLVIQEEYLLNISKTLDAGEAHYPQSLLAIGSLVGSLEREKEGVKGKFVKTFSRFSSKRNRENYKELFRQEIEEVPSDNTGDIQQ